MASDKRSHRFGNRFTSTVPNQCLRGSDIVLALALGANAVAIGKPVAFGLAAGGEKGVERTFTILKEELERTMGLVGARTIAELRSKGNEIFVKREQLRNSS